MKLPSIILTVACLLLVGCDHSNVAQYRIASAAVSSADRAKVREVLRSVAAETKLTDVTSTSKAPRTLVYYTQPDVQHFRVELGAREQGSDILVDLYAGFGARPAAYEDTRRLLTPALTQAFGTRVIEHHDP